MITLKIAMPKRLGPQEALNFCNELNQTDADIVLLDFAASQWFEPFGMLYCASSIKQFRRSNPKIRVVANNYHDKSYAIHMGFMKHCGFSNTSKRRPTAGNDTYSPIQEIRIAQLQKRAFSKFTAVQEEIEKASERISHMLVPDKQSKELRATVLYSIREIGRNVVEHSESANLLYCGQYWPLRNRIEVCMTDSGVGLQDTLCSNPYISVQSDKEAVDAAILPGISGKAISSVGMNDDEWANSGFGLYMLSRICVESGSFFIASGNSGSLINSASKRDVETNFRGTAVRIVLDPTKLESLTGMLNRFAAEGAKVAKEITGGAISGPSIASSTIRGALKIGM